MKNDKHTPGPWSINSVGYIIGPKGDDDLIAAPHGLANTILIATAPEMLEALEMITRRLDIAETEKDEHGCYMLASIHHNLKALIAKARGEK